MRLANFIPSPPLREYVKHFGIAHFVFTEKENIPAKAYTPKPEDSIDFFLRDPEFVTYPGETVKHKRSSASIAGQHTFTVNRQVGREFLFFQICFQPGALFRLTGIPSHELTNTFIDADTAFPKDIRIMEERLRNAGSYEELVTIAELFLSKLAAKSKKDSHRIDITAKMLLHHPGRISLDWLAKESCLSSKQFERKFYERMGISPSLFARLVRFDKTFRMKNRQPNNDWLSIALECGYYDYQHLVRDYKAFTGLTPVSFSLLENNAPERILGLKEV